MVIDWTGIECSEGGVDDYFGKYMEVFYVEWEKINGCIAISNKDDNNRL